MDLLKDPNGTRIVKTLPLPPQKPFDSSLLLKEHSATALKNFLKREGKVSLPDYIRLVKAAGHIFKSEPNLLHVDDPVTIVGDIHGQYYDFVRLLENDVSGNPEVTKYVFLGDYVDRGHFSIEVLLLILSMKVSNPNSIIMLRGNHECRQLTSYFSFRKECLDKYNQQAYDMTMEMFDMLPIACIVNRKFLCIHGGISHDLRSLEDIDNIDRFREIPKSGLFCDLMWADPIDNKNGYCESLCKTNTARGCSYYFGIEVAKAFFKKTRIISVIRAHEAQAEGFRMYKWSGTEKFPSVITIFSAPNYCDFYNNKGAVIRFENNVLNIQQFVESPHPYFLPDFVNLFSWSLPFVAEKVSQIMHHLIQPDKKFKQDSDLPLQMINRRNIIERFLLSSKAIVDKNLNYVSLDGNCPDERLLETGKFKIGKTKPFEIKKQIDLCNEQRPLEADANGLG